MWDRLPDDVLAELTDKEYTGRTHGRRATYAQGCHGPLCKKSERDLGHEKYTERRARQGKPPARSGLKDDKARERDELLTQIQAWHDLMREYTRLNKLVRSDNTELENAG